MTSLPRAQIRVLKFTLIVRVQSVTNRSQPMQMWVASASVRHAQHPFQQQCERTFCGSEIGKSPGPRSVAPFQKTWQCCNNATVAYCGSELKGDRPLLGACGVALPPLSHE